MAVIRVFAIVYPMLGKKILKMTPPSIQEFDMNGMGKLILIVTASDITREYLIKKKILPEHIKTNFNYLFEWAWPKLRNSSCVRCTRINIETQHATLSNCPQIDHPLRLE